MSLQGRDLKLIGAELDMAMEVHYEPKSKSRKGKWHADITMDVGHAAFGTDARGTTPDKALKAAFKLLWNEIGGHYIDDYYPAEVKAAFKRVVR